MGASGRKPGLSPDHPFRLMTGVIYVIRPSVMRRDYVFQDAGLRPTLSDLVGGARGPSAGGILIAPPTHVRFKDGFLNSLAISSSPLLSMSRRATTPPIP